MTHTGGSGKRRVRPIPSASRFFPDWLGEISVQQDLTKGPRLESLAGLDRRRWIVVAIDIELDHLGERGDRFFVDAVELGAINVEPGAVGFSELRAVADRDDVLPVTRIELIGTTLREMLAHVARGRISLHLNAIGTEIDIVAVRRYDTAASAE